jgi:hypothetical protein
MPWRGTSGSVLAGWYTKYQFGGRLVACPYITDISLSVFIYPARYPSWLDGCPTPEWTVAWALTRRLPEI